MVDPHGLGIAIGIIGVLSLLSAITLGMVAHDYLEKNPPVWESDPWPGSEKNTEPNSDAGEKCEGADPGSDTNNQRGDAKKPPPEDIEDMAEHSQDQGRQQRIPKDELTEMVDESIDRAIESGNIKDLERGRTAYLDPLTGRVSIHNPSIGEHSTTIDAGNIIGTPEGYFEGLR